MHLCGSRAWGAAIQEPCVPTRARSVMPQQCSACTACGTPKAPFLPSRPRVTTCCGPPLRHGHLLGVARGKITEVEHSGNCHKGWVPSETPEERGRPSSPMCEPRGGAGEEGGDAAKMLGRLACCHRKTSVSQRLSVRLQGSAGLWGGAERCGEVERGGGGEGRLGGPGGADHPHWDMQALHRCPTSRARRGSD